MKPHVFYSRYSSAEGIFCRGGKQIKESVSENSDFADENR